MMGHITTNQDSMGISDIHGDIWTTLEKSVNTHGLKMIEGNVSRISMMISWDVQHMITVLQPTIGNKWTVFSSFFEFFRVFSSSIHVYLFIFSAMMRGFPWITIFFVCVTIFCWQIKHVNLIVDHYFQGSISQHGNLLFLNPLVGE